MVYAFTAPSRRTLLSRFKRVSYTIEAVIPANSASSNGQEHVEQLQTVESELLSTREQLRVFEKTYREVSRLSFCTAEATIATAM